MIRWQHPERGLLPPAAFLPIIENHPISVQVGEWVGATRQTVTSIMSDFKRKGILDTRDHYIHIVDKIQPGALLH